MPVVVSRVDEGKDLVEDHTIAHSSSVEFHLSGGERHVHDDPADERNLQRGELDVQTEDAGVKLNTVPELINESHNGVCAHVTVNRLVSSVDLTSDVEPDGKTENKEQNSAAERRHVVVNNRGREELQDEGADVE